MMSDWETILGMCTVITNDLNALAKEVSALERPTELVNSARSAMADLLIALELADDDGKG